jgi:hypothetical protein
MKMYTKQFIDNRESAKTIYRHYLAQNDPEKTLCRFLVEAIFGRAIAALARAISIYRQNHKFDYVHS